MKTEIEFLTVEQVLRMHERSIDEHGGDPELRDRGLLESAIAMPAARFSGVFMHDGIAAMAAAYHFHICKNHAFVDGNKRTAALATEMFLELNGYRLSASNKEMEVLTLSVADGTLGKAELTKALRKFVKRHKR